ncbi:MAG: hypothetical protein V4611_04840 [Patescibacteria group bacterium]
MELFGSTSHRGFSVRSIFTFVIVVVVTAFLWALLGGQPAQAAGEATWNGASIMYEDDQYISAGKSKGTESHGIAQDASLYVFVEAPTSTSSAPTMQKAHIIYFTPGTDPPDATGATYVVYDYNPVTKAYSNPGGSVQISIDPDTASGGFTSCAIDGIGWIVCPIMHWLSVGMDSVFNALSGFMQVQPLQTGNTDGSLYSVWNIMRGVANIAFIIVFLIIIYSQLTNFQVSNYGLKKLIPRLIIAAIAVNLSYLICAVAIDISNVLGYAIQDMFLDVRDQVLGGNAQVDIASWESVTGFVISGGTAVAALGIGAGAAIIATGGTAAAAAFILLPALVGLLLAILVVLLILAARQALITILVIIAPLAIVAYLLPNTEKWFTQWRGLFFTLLVFFPAFSVVFGGSQLAGAIIIYNADSINMLILGMIVMVAPLVITPLLLKFSGGLIGNIARLVNNPNKGLVDRTRNWSKGHADWHRKRGTSGAKFNGDPGDLRKRNVMRQSARYLDGRKLRREDRTKNATTGAQTAYENSKLYGNKKYNVAAQTAAFEAEKNSTHAHHEAHVEGMKQRNTPGNVVYQRARNAEVAKEGLEGAQKRTETYYNSLRTTPGTDLNTSMTNLETSKSYYEASEQEKATYITRQKTSRVTALGIAAERLETAKLVGEGAQSRYTAYVDELKVSSTSGVSVAAVYAESSKGHAEAAQNQLQAFFDDQRRNVGSELNLSTIRVEETKATAETAKSLTSAFITDLKADETTQLHLNTIRAETAKLASQISETRLSRTIEEYKTGEITRTGELDTLMTTMVNDVAELAAEAQGSQAAQNIQKKNIAEAFTEVDATTGVRSARAQALLDTAASVDQYGAVRAEAGALSTLEKIIGEARSSNMQLIESRALKAGKTTKDYAVKTLLQERLDGTNLTESEDLIRAALEIAGQEAQIPILRKIRRSGNFNQQDVSAMLSRQSGVMKAKGGFDLQANPELANVSEQTMDASIAGTLGSVAPTDFPGLKFAAIVDYAARIDDIVTNAENETDPNYGPAGREGLQKTYFNLTIALKDTDLIRELGDNLAPSIDMHKRLHSKFNNPDAIIDYDKIDPRKA